MGKEGLFIIGKEGRGPWYLGGGQPMEESPKGLPADLSSRAAEQALGSVQGLASPPTLPGKCFAA